MKSALSTNSKDPLIQAARQIRHELIHSGRGPLPQNMLSELFNRGFTVSVGTLAKVWRQVDRGDISGFPVSDRFADFLCALLELSTPTNIHVPCDSSASRRTSSAAPASPGASRSSAQNFLDPEHGEQIVKWFQAFEDRAKVVSLDEVKDEGWTLNISRYVLPPIGEDIPPLPEAVAAFKKALANARAAKDQLRTVLTEGGWLQ